MQHRLIACAGILFAAVAMGCDPSHQASGQLGHVAKDWSLAIRASQVIPVYPLTEDVQVGDVFLVQTPYEDQVKVYEAKGFLPLENLVTRLHPTGYEEFYSQGYGADDRVPRGWQFPPGGSGADFGPAPRAAFPTYGFSVSRSEGLNVAVPVYSVPIGLNLLDTASANGTITIKDSYTYGRGIAELEVLAMKFASDHPDFVKQYASSNGQQFFLRVVNRVYLTKRMDVTLFANEGFGGSGSAGVPRPVELLNIAANKNASSVFDEVNKVINKQPSDASSGSAAPTTAPSATQPAGGATAAAPATAGATTSPTPVVGGSVKVTMASQRSVSLTESFDRPLVIGYLAIDLPIEPDGSLGAPVSTLAQLQARKTYKGQTVSYGQDANSQAIRDWLTGDGPRREQLNQYLADRTKPSAAPPIRNLINGKEFAELRQDVVSHFNISPAK